MGNGRVDAPPGAAPVSDVPHRPVVGVTRHERGTWLGWRVTITRAALGGQVQQYVSDAEHGGTERAMRTAIKLRSDLLNAHPGEYLLKSDPKPGSVKRWRRRRPLSEHPRKRARVEWEDYWEARITVHGTTHARAFSCHRYGIGEARRMAEQALEDFRKALC